jgi:hypothetical protein
MRWILTALLLASLAARAVTLDPDGLGQALIYPYYTVNSSSGNPFNTYITVVNHGDDAKVVRVRFREARMHAEVLSFNLFLGARDAWAAAVVPTASGARLLNSDGSCTDPQFGAGSPPFLDLRANAYAGDGAGDGIERTREGYVEILEMATLTDANRGAIEASLGTGARNCAIVRGDGSLAVAAPTGQVSGTLTLINVASGLDFTLNAEALDGLASSPYFRLPGDPYPDFNAAEIDKVSEITTGRVSYRSVWNRPVDAVSAVLMRSRWYTEYVLDVATASLTDVVFTFPTRRFYATAESVTPPFLARLGWKELCAGSGTREPYHYEMFNRDAQFFTFAPFDALHGEDPTFRSWCASTVVHSIYNGQPHTTASGAVSGVLGSSTQENLAILATFQNGWLRFTPTGSRSLSSLDASTRMDASTGAQSSGRHTYQGLPVVGFWARIFRNGQLDCVAGKCQGNYGSAWPLRGERSMSVGN